jgi:hypothetical protein
MRGADWWWVSYPSPTPSQTCPEPVEGWEGAFVVRWIGSSARGLIDGETCPREGATGEMQESQSTHWRKKLDLFCAKSGASICDENHIYVLQRQDWSQLTFWNGGRILKLKGGNNVANYLLFISSPNSVPALSAARPPNGRKPKVPDSVPASSGWFQKG